MPSLIQAQREQQAGDRQLTLTVDADVDDVLGVEFEIEPRTAVRNDAGCEQEFARAWVLPRSWSNNTPGERCIWRR